MKFPIRIPTLLGIFLVIVLTAGLGFGFEQISRSRTTASGSIIPTGIEITNVSDTTFTVTWQTESPATGAISVESPAAKQTLFDERDSTGALGSYTTHAVTMRTGRANTDYLFTILSNGKAHTQNGTPFRVRTASSLPASDFSLEPAFGIVLTEASLPADGAIVYLTPQGGQTLSALVKPSGSWVIPLHLARTNDLLSYLPAAERIDEDIVVTLGASQAIAATDTLNDNPVPDIVLGKTYDFRKQQAKASPTPAPLASANAAVLGQTTQVSGLFAITAPEQNAALTTNLPLIQGTGQPGKTVSITLGISNPFGGTTTIGADGIWRFTPSQRLDPGQQSVTATSQNASGQPVAVTHLFEVLKSGTQVLGDATPSATLTPTPTLIATDTATLAGQPVPTSGTMLPAILMVLMGIALFAGGGVLLKMP